MEDEINILSFKDVLGKKMLILGDVSKGKTRLTASLLQEAVSLGLSNEITVIDMAPECVVVKGVKFGGKIIDAVEDIGSSRYLAPRRVEAPRLKAKNSKELLDLVNKNKRRIKRCLKNYIDKPTPILFINDVSIYLQSGDLNTIIETISKASTVVANGYYGNTLIYDFSTGVSARERKLVEELASIMDIRINI
jgi:hypothetical protein